MPVIPPTLATAAETLTVASLMPRFWDRATSTRIGGYWRAWWFPSARPINDATRQCGPSRLDSAGPEVGAALKAGELDLAGLFALAQQDAAVAGMRVSTVLASLPRMGPRRSAAAMTELRIAPSRRLRGLGSIQRARPAGPPARIGAGGQLDSHSGAVRWI